MIRVKGLEVRNHMTSAGIHVIQLQAFTSKGVLSIEQASSEQDFPGPLIAFMLRDIADALDK